MGHEWCLLCHYVSPLVASSSNTNWHQDGTLINSPVLLEKSAPLGSTSHAGVCIRSKGAHSSPRVTVPRFAEQMAHPWVTDKIWFWNPNPDFACPQLSRSPKSRVLADRGGHWVRRIRRIQCSPCACDSRQSGLGRRRCAGRDLELCLLPSLPPGTHPSEKFERKQGLSAEKVPVSAYGGSLKILKDLTFEQDNELIMGQVCLRCCLR